MWATRLSQLESMCISVACSRTQANAAAALGGAMAAGAAAAPAAADPHAADPGLTDAGLGLIAGAFPALQSLEIYGCSSISEQGMEQAAGKKGLRLLVGRGKRWL